MDSLPTTSIAFPPASTSPLRSRTLSPYDQYVITSQPTRQEKMTITSFPKARYDGATNNVANRIRGGGYGIPFESWRGCMSSCCCCCFEEEGNNDFQPPSATQEKTQGTSSNGVPPLSEAQKLAAGEQDGQRSGQGGIIDDESFRSPSQPRDSATGPMPDNSRPEGEGGIDNASTPQSSPTAPGAEQPVQNEKHAAEQ
ncbi:unnamed protein product [Rhizoctonia solani]|uniref:Uncharacterized protein n=1 Tax=Rhizoctonia solani TaxID=456999 RepID=A0A8H3DQR5_9AGAM|nr:unnamed protein product [Rhizoctonia solani]